MRIHNVSAFPAKFCLQMYCVHGGWGILYVAVLCVYVLVCGLGNGRRLLSPLPPYPGCLAFIPSWRQYCISHCSEAAGIRQMLVCRGHGYFVHSRYIVDQSRIRLVAHGSTGTWGYGEIRAACECESSCLVFKEATVLCTIGL